MPALNLKIGPEMSTTSTTTAHSKHGSCSPPSLASTEKVDGEVDMRKSLFFASVLEKFKNDSTPDSEKLQKINLMWTAMDEKNRLKYTENVLKRKEPRESSLSNENNNKKAKYESRPGIEYNPARLNPVMVSQKNIDKVAKALGFGSSASVATTATSPSPSVPSTSQEIDVRPPPIRTAPQESYAQSVRNRIQFASMKSTLEQAKSSTKVMALPKETTPPPIFVANKPLTAPKTAPKRIVVTNKSFPTPLPPEIQAPLPPPKPAPRTSNAKTLQSSYTMVSTPKQPVENTKKEVKKVFKKSAPVKNMSYDEACAKYYTELSQRSLLNCHETTNLVNLENLANIVQGWRVTEYHGRL